MIRQDVGVGLGGVENATLIGACEGRGPQCARTATLCGCLHHGNQHDKMVRSQRALELILGFDGRRCIVVLTVSGNVSFLIRRGCGCEEGSRSFSGKIFKLEGCGENEIEDVGRMSLEGEGEGEP
eukprot:263361-Rhodomonas_salina.2